MRSTKVAVPPITTRSPRLRTFGPKLDCIAAWFSSRSAYLYSIHDSDLTEVLNRVRLSFGGFDGPLKFDIVDHNPELCAIKYEPFSASGAQDFTDSFVAIVLQELCSMGFDLLGVIPLPCTPPKKGLFGGSKSNAHEAPKSLYIFVTEGQVVPASKTPVVNVNSPRNLANAVPFWHA